jgi:uncharacterized protein YfeS
VKLTFILLLITSIAIHSYSQDVEEYYPSPETAHPKAKALLTKDYYWSAIDESGPFGNDDGADAFYSFREWRKKSKEWQTVDRLIS